MLHRIILIIIFARISCLAFCQTTNSYESNLLQFEEKVFACTTDSMKSEILFEKFNYEIKNNDYSLASFNDCIRIDRNLIKNDSSLRMFLWNASLISYINEERDYTLSYLESLDKISTTPSTSSKILSILNNYKYDTSVAHKEIKLLASSDSTFKCLKCLMEVDSYTKRNLGFFVYSSAIIPGSGNMFMGNIGKGLTSLALTGLITTFGINLWQNGLYINSVSLAATLLIKFYFGNIKLTEVEFRKKESKKRQKLSNICENKIKTLLSKYPLEFQK